MGKVSKQRPIEKNILGFKTSLFIPQTLYQFPFAYLKIPINQKKRGGFLGKTSSNF